MVYNFVATPQNNGKDELIATALNGEAYSENNRLHIKNVEWHLIYKYDGSPVGWYARNVKTNDDVYLGSGASPSIVLETLTVKNEEFWNSLLCPEVEETVEEGSE